MLKHLCPVAKKKSGFRTNCRQKELRLTWFTIIYIVGSDRAICRVMTRAGKHFSVLTVLCFRFGNRQIRKEQEYYEYV